MNLCRNTLHLSYRGLTAFDDFCLSSAVLLLAWGNLRLLRLPELAVSPLSLAAPLWVDQQTQIIQQPPPKYVKPCYLGKKLTFVQLELTP